MIQFSCACGTEIRVPESLGGMEGACSACARRTRVPGGALGRTIVLIFLVVDRETTARVLDLSSASFGTVLLWTLVAFAAAGASTFFTHTYIGPMLFYARTGISYREDRMAYARAGGYDFDRLAPRLALIGLFGVLWATSDSTSDPVGFVRSGWGYPLSTFVIAIVLTIAVCIVGFRLTTPGRH